jgi:hypothetical protein
LQVLPGAQQGSPGAPQVAHIPVAVVLAPSQVSPVAHALAAAPAQQMSPSAAPHAKHIMGPPAVPLVVHREPSLQVLFAQQTVPGEPHRTQNPLVSQVAPLLQLFPAQQP